MEVGLLSDMESGILGRGGEEGNGFPATSTWLSERFPLGLGPQLTSFSRLGLTGSSPLS